MKVKVENLKEIYRLFPSFPCVLVVVDRNIITIGMVHTFSFSPLLMGVGVSPERYSYNLLKDAEKFSINIPYVEHLNAIKICGERSGREVDKFLLTELTYHEVKGCGIIKELPVNIIIQKEKEVETGDHTWFIGRVIDCYKEKNYDREKAIMYWGGKYRLPGKIVEERY